MLNELIPAFQIEVRGLLAGCADLGVIMRPYYTRRTVFEQAKLWRQSRSREEIDRKIQSLRDDGAHFIAGVIELVGPQHGLWATNAAPGESWHQWGEAVDCFWLDNGKSNWSAEEVEGQKNGYLVYTDIAENMGLTAGGSWKKKDWVHVQLRDHSVDSIYTPREIDVEMRRLYG